MPCSLNGAAIASTLLSDKENAAIVSKSNLIPLNILRFLQPCK